MMKNGGKGHLSRAKETGYDGSWDAIIEAKCSSTSGFVSVMVWGRGYAPEGEASRIIRVIVEITTRVVISGNEGMQGSRKTQLNGGLNELEKGFGGGS